MATTPQSIDADNTRRFPPGVAAPAEGPNLQRQQQREPEPAELGPNFEKLEEFYPDVVATIRELVLMYRTEGIVSRRWEIRRYRQAHLFWQGIQYGYFSGQDYEWHLPFGTSVGLGLGVEDPAGEECPRYQFVTNIYQAFGVCFIALMSSNIPTPVFYPQSAQSEQDVTTAKAADDVRRVVEKNNSPKKLLKRLAWLMYCDGKVGGYVRYVADGERFGWQESTDMETASSKLGEDSYVCPNCGTEQPVESDVSGAGGFGMNQPTCESCGQPLEPEDIHQAEEVDIPRISDTRRTAKGQEVISLVPGLEFHTPPWADFQHEFPYLQWNLEVHIAKLKAAFPVAAPKIVPSGPMSADDVFARASRVSVKQGLPASHPGDALSNLITFTRTWIRKWCFWLIEDKDKREKCLKLFPNGCYVAFAADTYCESRNESMDDHWRVLQAMEGDGQNRPSVGDCMIPVQEQYNTLSNSEQETYDFGIPPILADAETLDFDALEETTAEPATYYPVTLRGQDKIADKVLQLQPSVVAPESIQRRQELMGPIGQFLTGITPTVFGAQLEGNDTARAYQLAREMALGRITCFWNELKWFYADIMLLAVRCFVENRPEDLEDTVKQEGGDFESKWIRLADLGGHLQVYDDPDETYPELPSQVRAMVTQLLEDPVFGPMFLKSPANMSTAATYLGLRDFEIPGEDSRIKQMRETEELLKSPPIQPPPQINPMTGMPVPTPPEPTIDVDPLFDNHMAEFEECQRYANSDEGQTEKMSNPAGWANFQAHAQKHKALADQMAAAQAPKKPPSVSLSVNAKDLTPSGMAQAAAEVGIQEDPNEIAAAQQQDKQEKAQQAAMRLQGQKAPPPQ